METKNNKKIIAVVSLVLSLAVAIIAGTLMVQATPANKLKRQLRLAEKYLTEMNYQQALIAYNGAIKIDQRCEAAYLAMADIYMTQGEEKKAVLILEEGQKNIQTDAMVKKIEEAKKQAASAKQTGIQPANAGEIITFGSYEQDGNTGNGAEPIEWLVLDNQGDKMLVISLYGLDCQPYNTTYTGTWETCTLRSWLNSEFYNTAFNDGEKASVITTTLDNPNNARYGTSGGNATSDNVFCLSPDEAEKYFTSKESRATKPTAYAVSRGAYASASKSWYEGNCYWWLRSPVINRYIATHVDTFGLVYDDTYSVCNSFYTVRPALWIGVNR